MYPIVPMQRTEIGPALKAVAAGVAVTAYSAAGLANGIGEAIPQSEGRLCTFCITLNAMVSAALTAIGFHLQGTNDALSGSPTWTNCAPHPLVQSGRFPSISPAVLGIYAGSVARTPPAGPTLTSEQQAIEARRLVRFNANGFLNWTVDLEDTGYAHHRIVVNQVTGGVPILSATWIKTHLKCHGSSHLFECSKDIPRPGAGAFTDAQWAQYLDEGVIPTAVTNQDAILQLAQNRAPTRPAGLSNAQWDALRNTIVEEGLMLQHRPDGV